VAAESELDTRTYNYLQQIVFRLLKFCYIGIYPRDAMLARRNAVLAVIVCLSVRPSVTSRCSTKTAKPRITQITPYDHQLTKLLKQYSGTFSTQPCPIAVFLRHTVSPDKCVRCDYMCEDPAFLFVVYLVRC